MKQFLLAALLALASVAQANVISTTVYVDNQPGESVQYVDFHVTDAGYFSIYSHESLISIFTDPHVLLFSNPLSSLNFITGNDNGGLGDDSWIQRNLDIGSYVLAISNSFLTVSEAVAGYNPDINWLNDGFINVTISSKDGIATFDNPSAVPVPAAAWLFGTGLLGFAGLRKRKSA
jgi:hypothetical protein